MSAKNTTLTALTILVFLWLVKIFNISYPLTVVNTARTSELAVVGEGKIEAVPDTAFVDAGITINNALTVEEAQTTINKVSNEIVRVMKNLGINKSDIKTSNYSIYPNYDYDAGSNRISGYNGNVTISIKTKKLELVSRIIEEATKAGANQIQGVRFVIDEPDKYRELARTEAINNAKEQAEKLTKNLKIKLGRVVNIVESTPQTPQPFFSASALEKSGAGGGGAAIEPGSQTITSTVTLYFEKR